MAPTLALNFLLPTRCWLPPARTWQARARPAGTLLAAQVPRDTPSVSVRPPGYWTYFNCPSSIPRDCEVPGSTACAAMPTMFALPLTRTERSRPASLPQSLLVSPTQGAGLARRTNLSASQGLAASLASRLRLAETKRPAAASRGAFGPNIQVIQTAYPDNDPGTAARKKHLQHRNSYL